MIAAVVLVVAALALLAWWRYTHEPERPEASWFCPWPPCCEPGNPCSDACGWIGGVR